MNSLRNLVEKIYQNQKGRIFEETKEDPEEAHKYFTELAQIIYAFGLSGILLDNSANKKHSKISLVNAAGFNKNGDIPPKFLRYLGFDEIIIGTVTNNSYEGNSRPRIKRFPNTHSLVNWMGLPGIGSYEVALNIKRYGEDPKNIIANIMATPGKHREEALEDLKRTVSDLNGLCCGYELNISCPNTSHSREEYQSNLRRMLEVVSKSKNKEFVNLKVSPDLDEKGVDDIISAGDEFGVYGYTTTNTTTYHDKRYIPESPGKGGASGNAVYERALKVQRMFEEKIDHDRNVINACGGINTIEKLRERTSSNLIEQVQIFTPLIFQGPGLIREFREALPCINH